MAGQLAATHHARQLADGASTSPRSGLGRQNHSTATQTAAPSTPMASITSPAGTPCKDALEDSRAEDAAHRVDQRSLTRQHLLETFGGPMKSSSGPTSVAACDSGRRVQRRW